MFLFVAGRGLLGDASVQVSSVALAVTLTGRGGRRLLLNVGLNGL